MPRWLRENRHLRYMWLPYTDTAVVVQCNPLDSAPAAARAAAAASAQPAASSTQSTAEERVRPLRELLLRRAPGLEAAAVEGLSATELRDALLVLDPLDKDWVAQVNQAEAEYWKRWGLLLRVCGQVQPCKLYDGLQACGWSKCIHDIHHSLWLRSRACK